jgi:hypothetical protein
MGKIDSLLLYFSYNLTSDIIIMDRSTSETERQIVLCSGFTSRLIDN